MTLDFSGRRPALQCFCLALAITVTLLASSAQVADATTLSQYSLGGSASQHPISHPNWIPDALHTRPDQSATSSLSFVLKQRNAHLLEKMLLERSEPSSPMYGKHMSRPELDALTSPEASTITSWNEWASTLIHQLTGKPAEPKSIQWNESKDILRIKLPVSHMESLLGSPLHWYTHADTGARHLRSCTSSMELISGSRKSLLPTHLLSSIEYIAGATRFPAQVEMLRNNDAPVPHQPSFKAKFPKTDAKPIEVETPEKLSDGPPDYYGEQQILHSVRLSTDNQNFIGIFLLACATPVTGGQNWTYPMLTSFSPPTFVCFMNGQTWTYASTTLTLKQPDGSHQTSFSYSATAFPIQLTNSLHAALQLNVPMPTNYDAYELSVTFYWQTTVLTPITYTYPFTINGLTGVYSRTPSQLYNVPDWLTFALPPVAETMSIAALAIGETSQGFYDPTDLIKYYYTNNLDVNTVDLITYYDNTTPTVQNDPTNPDDETMLDISATTGINQNTPLSILHLTGDTDTPFEDLLKIAMLDPSIHTLSISYGIYEGALADSIGAISTLLQKAGAVGISVIAASGDTGAFLTLANRFGNFTSVCAQFLPSFPASSPWVTSVGGSTLRRSSANACPTEVAASLEFGAVITSGGGFSTLSQHAMPDYQKEAVAAYLNNSACIKPTTLPFNPANRAYPDVTLLAHNYYIWNKGSESAVDGTSASSPVLAGIISMYNKVRIANKQTSLGWLNPTLYALAKTEPRAFNDITQGSNRCLSSGKGCCPEAFQACPGFDPVTGLGSPNFKYLGPLLVPSVTLPVNVSNFFFPDCPNYVPWTPTAWPGDEKPTHAPVGVVVLLTLLAIGVIAAAVYFCMKRYHAIKYGGIAAARRGNEPQQPMQNLGPNSGGNAPAPRYLVSRPQPEAAAPSNSNWRSGTGYRLGEAAPGTPSNSNPLDVPLNRQ